MHERRLPPDGRFSGLVKLFLLGLALPVAEAEAALGRSRLGRLEDALWVERHEGGIRATVKVVPHGDVLVASDRDGGPSGADWVAGIHPPSVTLAKLTIRGPVKRALDVATGNGIQALLASRHAESVVATDVNPRALAFAGLNARLNGVDNLEVRQGSFFEPAVGEQFDLLTCNPPYVISPEARYVYRDSGLPGDTVSRRVVEQAPGLLDEGGFAHILVSWAHAVGDPWSPVERWVEGNGCDSWLLHFGSDDPVTHAAEWLKPVAAGDVERYRESLTEWLDYLERLGIEAIAHGAVILRGRLGARNWVRKDRIDLDRLEQAGEHVLRVFRSQDFLEATDDVQLLDSHFSLAERHQLQQTVVCRDGGTVLESSTLSLDDGFRFRVALDVHTARLVPALDGRPLREALAGLQASPEDSERFASAALPVVRRLVELGFLLPEG